MKWNPEEGESDKEREVMNRSWASQTNHVSWDECSSDSEGIEGGWNGDTVIADSEGDGAEKDGFIQNCWWGLTVEGEDQLAEDGGDNVAGEEFRRDGGEFVGGQSEEPVMRSPLAVIRAIEETMKENINGSVKVRFVQFEED
ncbi:hypothetical protein F0562_019137 [Nyssa sinensis]|uniref:Uncharacterized protein n=1 Tax=Nyssa sinensis TaxID=561372 RepID=A0A5J4ZEL4_9ASTE|nr:hypothetical protein F0562_019137 [Nyssa sinensis]